jgi:hypothetical protein
MVLTVIMEGICKAAAILSVLMKVCAIPCHDRGHINVMLVLQSCTDSLQVMAGSSSETFPTSPDGTLDIGNIKVEELADIKEEEEEVNVKTENVIGSEEEECMDIKEEEGANSEEEDEEEKIDIQEKEDVDVKEEVSCQDTV